MSVFHRIDDKRLSDDQQPPENSSRGPSRLSERAGSPSGHMEQEKRIRREIANSNERRRMQSINAGFQSLRTLLPQHEGEKLSKAAILQQTAEYIYTLEQEKTRLLSQNCQLKRIINQHEGEASSAVKKRKTDHGPLTIVAAAVSESSDEGIGSMSPEPVNVGAAQGVQGAQGLQSGATADQESATEALRREVMELRVNLDRERRMRLVLESQVRSLQTPVSIETQTQVSLETQTQVYPERIRELHQVHLQYHPDMETWQDDQPIEEGVYTVKTEVELPHTMIHQSVMECEAAATRREALTSSRALIQETEEAVAQIQATTIVSTACSTSPMYAVDSGENLSMGMPAASPSPSPSPCPSPSPALAPVTLVVAPPPVTLPLSLPLSPAPSPRPLALAVEQRLPSVLEAAIKAEPKVEVERLPSSANAPDDSPQARLYVANTSRQNLETIVEAIRHLEGDHLFSDDPSPHRLNCGAPSVAPSGVPSGANNGATATTVLSSAAALSSPAVVERLQECPQAEPTQEVPLALITNSRTQCSEQQRLIKVKMDPFLQFHAVTVQQQRPGVIVEKQHT